MSSFCFKRMNRVITIDHREPKKIIEYFMKLKSKYESLEDITIEVKQMKVSDIEYEDDERVILAERKAVQDALESVYDSRLYEQLENVENFTIEGKKVVKILIITGNLTDVKLVVDRLRKKGKNVNKYSILAQLNGVIKDFLKKGIVTINLLDDAMLVDFILKVVEDKDFDYEPGMRYLHQNKKTINRFTLSLMALVDRLGKQKARIISTFYHTYKELQVTNVVDLSNLIRKELKNGESKKPMEKIVELFTYL